MASRMTGKQRAARIPLDYFKKRDALGRWKLILSGGALVGVAVWMASGFSLGGPGGFIHENDRGRMLASHGPVARVHAVWDAKCEACHLPFTSIDGQKWAGTLGLKSGNPSTRCSSCHQVADHSMKSKADEVESCASCHRDHQGRDFSLVDIADGSCINCHGDLKSHSADGAKVEVANAITGFPLGHPEFKLFATEGKEPVDPGKIKFNHALHMTPGFSNTKDGKPVWTLAQFLKDEAARAKYGLPGQKDGDKVKLSCNSCHHLDASGSSYTPITHEQDCKSCHAIKVKMDETIVEVPHHLQPRAIHDFLTNESLGQAMKAPATEKVVAVPLPGRTPAVLKTRPEPQAIAARINAAEKTLFAGTGDKQTCTECHSYQIDGKIHRNFPADAKFETTLIAKPGMNAVWYEKARFDHAAHRGVSCKSCHDGAYADSKKETDVLLVGRTGDGSPLAGKALCVQCHGPAGSDKKGKAIGGAGTSCVECHQYHGGGHGGSKTVIDGTKDITDFLAGTSKPRPPAPDPRPPLP